MATPEEKSTKSQSFRNSDGGEPDNVYGGLEEPDFEFDDEMGTDLEAHEVPEDADDQGSDDGYFHNTHGYLSFISGTSDSFSKQTGDNGVGGTLGADAMVDDDFEAQLGSPAEEEDNDPEKDFRDLSKYGILQVAGDDTCGRKVIVFSACNLPPREDLEAINGQPHAKLLLYLKHTLDQYVENDYTLVYFHYGLNSRNKPSISWLRQAYRDFDRKYKKNLKALFIVHSSNFIKIVWNVFKLFISKKFTEKVTYLNYLHELAQYIPLDQLNIPKAVQYYDAQQLAKYKPQPVPTSIIHAPLRTQQFGVSLQFIKDNNNGNIIPPVLEACVKYIRSNGLYTEGIFRRSANAVVLKTVQSEFNKGAQVDFDVYGDIHLPAALLKSFLRQLSEPILTYDLYDHIVHVQSLDHFQRVAEMQRLLVDELPEDNYYVLKYVIELLTEVVQHSGVNRMTAENLAIVFGPNLLWSKSQASLTSLGYVNNCARLLITQHKELFNK